MSKSSANQLRCAIYTRVSTEYGLEQDFNSLDAQREAAEAYIKSQAHEGWRLQPGHYNDGGFSGGSLERPALQNLLAAIRQRKIDVVVVYKVDRLTRSLADFAKLVELFDAHDVSFVSVTQAFNTTTSMGRLTLNVLLSFAQFEREVTGERIRDKVAASKRKGMRMGGPVPLGYDVVEKKLIPNAEEAERVRDVFQTYLKYKSLTQTLGDLRTRGILTKLSRRKDGSTRGGIDFNKNGLSYLLKNRVYLGEIVHKGAYFPGEHSGVVDRSIFEEVQSILTAQTKERGGPRLREAYILAGKLFDSAGNRMSPATARKGAVNYRYYVSTAATQGKTPGAITRLAADILEAAIIKILVRKRGEQNNVAVDASEWAARIERVTINSGQIEIITKAQGRSKARSIREPWTAPTVVRKREIISAPDRDEGRPIRGETRARLLESIAKARRWVSDLSRGRVRDLGSIATRENTSERSVRMTISLAFLSPQIVTAVIAGTVPDRYGLMQMMDAPCLWQEQTSTVFATG